MFLIPVDIVSFSVPIFFLSVSSVSPENTLAHWGGEMVGESSMGTGITITFEGFAHEGGQAGAVNLVGDEFPDIHLTPGSGADGLFVGIPDSSISMDNNVSFFGRDFVATSGVAVFSPDLYQYPGNPAPSGVLVIDFETPTTSVGAYFLDVEGAVSSIEAFDGPGGSGHSLGRVTLQDRGDNSQSFEGIVAEGIQSAILNMGGGFDGVGIDDLCYGCVAKSEIDIKPLSCPNPLNPNDRGVLPVAILGMEDFDVNKIIPSSIKLVGVSPLRYSLEDVATPMIGECEVCTHWGADGFRDLSLKFSNQEILHALGEIRDGQILCLRLTGVLEDGSHIVGEDGVVIRFKRGGSQSAGFLQEDPPFSLFQNFPNPLVSTTTIRFAIPVDSRQSTDCRIDKNVSLKVFDLTGRLVKTLVECEQEAGFYTVEWDGKDDRGREILQGVYFYSLAARSGLAGEKILTRKMTKVRRKEEIQKPE